MNRCILCTQAWFYRARLYTYDITQYEHLIVNIKYIHMYIRTPDKTINFLIVFCLGEITAKTVLYFHTRASVAVWKIQYSGWQIQYGGQSRGVKNLMNGGITTDHINNTSVNNVM